MIWQWLLTFLVGGVPNFRTFKVPHGIIEIGVVITTRGSLSNQMRRTSCTTVNVLDRESDLCVALVNYLSIQM